MQMQRMNLAQRRPMPFKSGTCPMPSVARLSTRPQPMPVSCKAAPEDPYKVLGIERDADSTEIGKAWRMKKYAYRNEPEMVAKVEAAHSQIMLSQLSNRMKGKGVDKSIAYADQEPLFPWRPKRWDATPKVILIVGAMQLGMVAYGFQQPSLSKTIFCGLIGIVGNVLKQNAIFPPPEDPEFATEEETSRPGRNFVRGFLLAVFSTFAGTLLFSLPEVLVQNMKLTLPVLPGVPNIIVSAKILGSALFNFIITAFYY